MLASSAAIMWGLSAVVAGDVFEVVSPSYVTQFRAVAVAVAFLPMIRRAPSHNLAGSRLALIAFGLTLAAVTFSFYWAVDLLGSWSWFHHSVRGTGTCARVVSIDPRCALQHVHLDRGRRSCDRGRIDNESLGCHRQSAGSTCRSAGRVLLCGLLGAGRAPFCATTGRGGDGVWFRGGGRGPL